MRRKINVKTKNLKKKIIVTVVILVFLFFTCLSLALMNRNYFLIEKGFKNLSSMISSYVQSNMYSASGFSKNVLSSRLTYLEEENNKLRKSLELTQTKNNYVIAEVTNHTLKNWFDKVEVSKGYNDGVKKDDVVISSEGLIGFVSKVSGKMCEVDLITGSSEDNMLSVIIETNEGNVSGVLKDYDEKTGLFMVSDVVSKNNILAGDRVVLSGYDNDAYKGIYVGMVVKEEVMNYGLNKTVWVESSVNFDDLLFVAIVKEKK